MCSPRFSVRDCRLGRHNGKATETRVNTPISRKAKERTLALPKARCFTKMPKYSKFGGCHLFFLESGVFSKRQRSVRVATLPVFPRYEAISTEGAWCWSPSLRLALTWLSHTEKRPGGQCQS